MKNTWITTYSGQRFFPFDPDPDTIKIDDIAHALSRIPRFAGHTRGVYTVAHHSVYVAGRLADEREAPIVQLWGLLHDAAEAYMGDIPRPIKDKIPELKKIESNIQRAVALAFNIPHYSWSEDRVNVADVRSMLTEGWHLLADRGAVFSAATAGGYGNYSMFAVPPLVCSAQEAKEKFLRLFAQLRS